MLRTLLILAALACGAGAPLPALAEGISPRAPDMSPRPMTRPAGWVASIPEARWDGAPGRTGWSVSVLRALRSHASALPDTVPGDIAAWCPAYVSNDRAGREAFWLGLVSALARHESTYRPTAVGGGGRWFGLTQIYPPTARHFDCRARTGTELLDPRRNLSCALRIMAVTVPRDGVVSRGMRGVAADWGPFHSRRKREDMRSWLRTQPYCIGLASSLRPVARPAVPSALAGIRPAARPALVLAGDATLPERARHHP